MYRRIVNLSYGTASLKLCRNFSSIFALNLLNFLFGFVAMEASVEKESISFRLTKLNQLLAGRSSLSLPHKSLLSCDGLLDSLFVLFDECSCDYLARNQYVSAFVKKCKYLFVFSFIVLLILSAFVVAKKFFEMFKLL